MGKSVGITITVNSQNIANNTSTVTVKSWIRTTGDSVTGQNRDTSLTIDGITYRGNSPAPKNSTTTLITKTVTIEHNSDGTKTLATSAVYSWYDGSSIKSGTVSKTLPAIPRSATLTAAPNTITGNNCVCKFKPTTTTYYYSLKLSCGTVNETKDIGQQSNVDAETSVTFDMSVSKWNKAIPNSETGTVTAELMTYSDSARTNQIGTTDTKTFTLTANASCKPNAPSVTLSPTGTGLSGSYYIQNRSKLSASITSSSMANEPSGGASVARYTVSVDGTQIGSGEETSYESQILTKAGTIPVVVTAIDTRGRSASTTQNINVYAYLNPVVTLNVFRCSSGGTANPGGQYAKAAYTATCTAISNANTCSVYSYTYKKVGAATSTNMPSNNAEQIFGNNTLLTSERYAVTLVVRDTVGGETTVTTIIPTSEVMMSFHSNGKGIGIGKVPEYGYNLEVARPIDTVYGITMFNEAGVRGNTINPARRDSANLQANGIVGMNHFLATGVMTNGKPSSNGHIIHMDYDNGAYQSQLFVSANDGGSIQWRTQAGVANWNGRNWITVLDQNNWSSYITTGLTTAQKNALIAVLENCAFKDTNGQTLINTLKTALGMT